MLLLGVLVVFAVAVVVLSVLMVFLRPVYDALHPEPYVLDAVWKCFLAWGVVHGFGAAHGFLGWAGAVPVVTRLGLRPRVRNVVRGAAVVLGAFALVASALALHASTLVRGDAAPGTVYFVYEDNGVVPRWVFGLAFYQMALETRRCYGEGEAVMLRITKENLRRALQEGTFVVVGSHGQAQGIIAEHEWFAPHDLAPGDVGMQLREVYLAGCDSGALAQDWERALSPARVITHDRLTAVVEHAWWLWMQGPAELREVARKEAKVKRTLEKLGTPQAPDAADAARAR